MLLALELDDRCDCGSAIVFLEEGSLKGLAWHAFEAPGLHDALRAHDLAEFTAETVFGTFSVEVGEVPLAARSAVHPLAGHLVLSLPDRFSIEFRSCIFSEHQ